MTTQDHSITYGEKRIAYRLDRRARKTLEIAVEPDMSVSVAAPLEATVSDIEKRLKKRAAWIVRQQNFFQQFVPRTPERKYIGGETHLYLGRQYRLKIQPGLIDHVRYFRGRIWVSTTRPKSPSYTEILVKAWYKDRAKSKLTDRITACQQRFSKPEEVAPKTVSIRVLKQRWGSMTPAGQLILNRRLVEAPVHAIDYVITHELCHIREPHHGTVFFDYLTEVMPDWRERKEHLERVLA